MGNNGSNFLYSLLFTLYSLSERKWLQKCGTHTAYWREKDLYFPPPPFFLPSGDRFSLHANLRKCQTHICVTKPKKTYQSVNPYISFTILSVSYFSKLIWLRLSLFFLNVFSIHFHKFILSTEALISLLHDDPGVVYMYVLFCIHSK